MNPKIDWDPNQRYYPDLPAEERSRWYDPVAATYVRTRPCYPAALVAQAWEAAGLVTQTSRVLEIGCGPGIATVDLAQRGMTLVALEPSGAAAAIARQRCAAYPQVSIQQTSFEDWEVEPQGFDAVVATTSFHWLSPEVRYAKTAAALKPKGALMLLWNVPPQPALDVAEQLTSAYATHAPQLTAYEDRTQQAQQLRALGEDAIATGLYRDIAFHRIECDRTYSITDYLALLSTLSPYMALDGPTRQALFSALGDCLAQQGQTVKTTYFSAAHILQLV